MGGCGSENEESRFVLPEDVVEATLMALLESLELDLSFLVSDLL